MKTFKNFIQTLTEKSLTNAELQDLIDRAEKDVRAVMKDKTKSKSEISRAKKVLAWIKGVAATFSKEGKLHPNAVNGLMRIVSGVGSGRFGWTVSGWKKTGDGKVPDNYAR